MARTKRKVNPIAEKTEAAVKEQKTYIAAAYARLSVEDSGKRDSDTIEGQKRLLLDFIERTPNLTLYKLYCDNGRSGINFERPGFAALMEDVKSGRVNCIVTKDLSRFARNYKEAGNYIERIFPFLGVRFIAVNDSFDTLTAERGANGYIIPLKNLINETYSRDISKKSGAALAVKQRNGDFIGAWAPYGYRKRGDDPHKLEPEPETAIVVRKIFALRVNGVSYNKIARKLNENGIASPSKYLYDTGIVKTEKYRDTVWTIETVKAILQRQVYIGHMVQGVKYQSFHDGKSQTYKPEDEWKVVKNTHEPIIDEQTFAVARDMAKQRASEYNEKLGKFTELETSENILKGLIFCADCHKPMTRYKNISHGKKLWYTFICQTHADNPAACPYKNIREEALFELLTLAIRKQTELAADMEEVTRKLNQSPQFRKSSATLERQLENAKKSIRRCEALRDGLYQNYVEKLMTETEYIALKRRYTDEAEEHTERLAQIEEQLEISKVLTPDNRFLTAFGYFRENIVLNSEIARELIERIEIGDGNSVAITFRYRDEYETLAERLKSEASLI